MKVVRKPRVKRRVRVVARKRRNVKGRTIRRKLSVNPLRNYNKAYDSGFDEAYNEGFNVGYNSGLEAGHLEVSKGD